MLWIDWILLGAGGVGVGGVAVVIFSAGRRLRFLDLDAMPRAKLRSRKYALIEERLQRKFVGWRAHGSTILGPFTERVLTLFRDWTAKVEQMEEKYRHAVLRVPLTQEEKEARRQKIASLLDQGQKVFGGGQWEEAEKMFLEVIRLHPKEVDAYEYLGEVYLQKKEYDHAIESLEFARKLRPDSDRILCDLGYVYQQKGDARKALQYFKQCVRVSPNNPRNLDYLLQIAIIMHDKLLALKTLKQLRQVNPENQKIPELEKQIAEL